MLAVQSHFNGNGSSMMGPVSPAPSSTDTGSSLGAELVLAIDSPTTPPPHHNDIESLDYSSSSQKSPNLLDVGKHQHVDYTPFPFAFYASLPPHFVCQSCVKQHKVTRVGSSLKAKLLPCKHSICCDCLKLLISQHKFFLPCPICRQHFPIPSSRKYPDNWLLFDATIKASKMLETEHINLGPESVITSDNDSESDIGHRTTYCSIHDLHPLEYFCQTCDFPVCVDCLKPPSLKLDSSEEFLSTDLSSTSSTAPLQSVSRHEGHSYTPLMAAKKVERLKISRLAQALQMRIGEAEDAAEHLRVIEQNLNSRLEDSQQLINKSFDRLIERLNTRRHELENQLTATCQQKQTVISNNRQAVTSCIASAKASADFLQKLLDQCGEGKDHDDSNSSAQQSLDLVVVRKQLEQQTEVVLQPFPLNTVHLEETQLLFSFVDCASEKLLRSIDSFGAIIANGTEMSVPSSNLLSPIDADETKSVASVAAHSLSSADYALRSSQIIPGPMPVDIVIKPASSSSLSSAAERLRSWSSCIVGVPQVIMLTAVDDQGQDAPLPANHEKALTVVIRDAVERVGTCDLKRVSAAGFLLTFTIPKEGIFEMEICLFGMPVSSSPFVVRSYPVGTQISTPSQSSHNLAAGVLGNSHTLNAPNHATVLSRFPSKARPQSTSAFKQGATNHSLLQHSEANGKPPSSRAASIAADDLRLSKASSSLASENLTPRLSVASARSATGTRLPPNKGAVNSPLLRPRTAVAPVTSRTRSKSTCGPKLGHNHAADCPSHHNNADSAHHGPSKPEGVKTAELEQLRNFCKRVVMLTSGGGGGNSHGDVADSETASTHGPVATSHSQMDDFLFSFGRKGRGKGEFSNIQDVCVTPDGRLLVSDSGNQCIQVFSSTGEYRFRFGQAGRNPGQLARPTGLASEADKIFVADYENRCVHMFNEDGRHIGRIGVGRLLGPKGICLVPATSLIVAVDNRASEVQIFDIRSHKLVSKFGSRGSQPHNLAGPHFAAILDNRFCTSSTSNEITSHPELHVSGTASRPRIAVTDFHNHAVKVFDMEGRLQSVIGNGIGEGQGQFNAATGLAIDNSDGGTIYAADWGNSRIQVFTPGGAHRCVVNCFSGPPIFGPQGIAIDSQKMRLIVADSGNHCIKVFRNASQTTCYL